MIKFQKCRWKNLLSTGDQFTEVQLDRSPSTLIVGQNGAGKSTLLDALSFSLFGKAHRNINKAGLLNSINNKHCVVETEFTIGKHEFKIVRGIKPNKFEIWQNGNMINQDASSRDYQKYLEQNILHLNHKSFHQIVVLGSSSFIPFMQLSAGARREVIEDLLDINIFTKMNIILKEQSAKVKEQLKDNAYTLDLIKEKIELQKKYIREVTEINDVNKASKIQQIEELQETISNLQAENTTTSEILSATLPGLQTKQKELSDEKRKLQDFKVNFESKIKSIVGEVKFFESNDHCPTCTQSISADLKQGKLDEGTSKAKEIQQGIDGVNKELDRIMAEVEEVTSSLSDMNDKSNTLHSNNTTIGHLQKNITTLNAELEKLTGSTSDVGQANKDLANLQEQRETLNELKFELNDKKSYLEACAAMLKDTGIKTKIIKEYVPVMNSLVNKYLQVLDFFVNFNLDENFDETIKSRHRDAFKYSSFSEGEKMKIDLSLLFTWRQIARSKNSCATNLLILDETFDSSLDGDSTDNLLKILDTLEDGTNVFVISHKGDILDGKFRSKMEFKKERNFSVMC